MPRGSMNRIIQTQLERKLGEVGGQEQGGTGTGKNCLISTKSTKYNKIQIITDNIKSEFFNFILPPSNEYITN